MQKQRLDILMTQNNLARSREQAKALIMAGAVLVDHKVVAKAGEMVPIGCEITIRQPSCPFVSRGGLKLAKAISEFSISLQDKTCMDIGASTGGFTDCMLQHGAKRVYAIDVGYGQFDWKLRNDPRVVLMERTNARYLTADSVADKPEFASADVSFISLRLIFPPLKDIGIQEIVTLIKPQFEAGREHVGKRGVVRDPQVHKQVIADVFGFGQQNGYFPKMITYSPVTGPNGNIEYLAYFTQEGAEAGISGVETVDKAFLEFK